MNVIIRAKALSQYQLKSLCHFGMIIKSNPCGIYYSEQKFESYEIAKDFLRERASIYAETDDELNYLNDQINKGYLNLDAVTAVIENVFD